MTYLPAFFQYPGLSLPRPETGMGGQEYFGAGSIGSIPAPFRLLAQDNYGRDHHPRCFTVWLAGGGIKPGTTHGSTDDFCYNIAADPVHVHDLHATILHLLGVDHTRLTYKFQGRHYRLTDVHGKVVTPILA